MKISKVTNIYLEIKKYYKQTQINIHKMEITFLGTTSMVPTKERNHIATFINYGSEGILIDCGEGTQRQMKISGIKVTKVTKILISHWHGDHILGLPGLIQTMAASEYNGVLEIYGPVGIKKRIKDIFDVFIFDKNIQIKVKEIKKKKFYDGKYFYLEALELSHGIKCFGFNFIEKDHRRINIRKIKELGIPECPLLGKLQENKSIVFKGKKITPEETTYVVKGKKITIISDTLVCKNCYELSKDADLLICEASYKSDLEEKAQEYKHLTAKQAAQIASISNVKRLILTHISARYKDPKEIEEDAKQIFDNVVVAYDLMKVKV